MALARAKESTNEAVVAGAEQTKRMIEKLVEQRHAEQVGFAPRFARSEFAKRWRVDAT